METTVIWAVKVGEPDWKRDLILERNGKIDDKLLAEVKNWCALHNFDRIKVEIINSDNLERPDFSNSNLINI